MDKTLVTLKAKDVKSRTKQFGIDHANKILKLSNSQWELNDDNFEWNGTELAKKGKTEKK